MPKKTRPRHGSLQYWPRKRARKILPSVNWSALKKDKTGFLGFIAYKVGMSSCIVKDNTPNSMTKGNRIAVPATILEGPPLKILSVRFYKNNNLVGEILLGQDKELKKKIKLPKKKREKQVLEFKKDYDNIRVIVYSLVGRTGIKKKPDFAELGMSGTKEEKLEFIKNFLDREISLGDVFQDRQELIDIRGLTKGKGTQGPVKRFGINLRQHKSEKGVRKVGSIGPWHPAHVSFRIPMAGQLGLFTRLTYNNKILKIGKISEKNINPKSGWKHYGNIKTDYIIVKGSVQGPTKRQLLLAVPLRKRKKQEKKNYEFMGLK